MEKPHFRPCIVPDHLIGPHIVKVKLSNRRILAQSGGFLVFGLFPHIFSSGPDFSIEEIIISGRHKDNILGELREIGTHESVMFPEIDKASKYILESL